MVETKAVEVEVGVVLLVAVAVVVSFTGFMGLDPVVFGLVEIAVVFTMFGAGAIVVDA